MWGWSCSDTSGKGSEGLHKGSSSLIPSSGKGGDAVPAPQPGGGTGRRQGFQGWLNLALWDGASTALVADLQPKHCTLWVLPVPHTSGHRNHKAGKHGLVGCSALGREDLSCHADSLPSRLVSSTLICHQEERSSFLFIIFH